MKIRRILLTIGIFSLIVLACSPDDPVFIPAEPRDRTEQQAIDNALLLEYLETHHYNSEALSNMTNPLPSDIEIEELGTDGVVPPGNTLLIDSDLLVTRTTVFEDTEYEYYILRLNQGGGDFSPNFSDRIRTIYEGRLVSNDNTVFDSAVTPIDFNLVGGGPNSGGVITGWQRVFPEFNTAASVVPGATTTFNDFGLGVMFIPSGLGFFSGPLTGVPDSSFSNLIFKFALLQGVEFDHDNDGIPSHVEDLNNDLSVFDEDTDEDLIVNYVDPDDDGDGVLTINELERTEYIVDTNNQGTEPVLGTNEFELSRTEDMGIITIITGTIVDRNNNEIPDYLDSDATDDLSSEG